MGHATPSGRDTGAAADVLPGGEDRQPPGGVPAELAEGYRAALPRARADVLARLWGCLTRDPLAGVAMRHREGDALVVTLADGRRVRGPAEAATPFAARPRDLTISVDEHPHTDPADLLAALDLPGPATGLARELAAAELSLALAEAARPRPHGGAPTLLWLAGQNQVDPIAYLEQSVLDGHPLHPCSRTRLGFTAADILAYAPEHRPVVDLEVFAVPENRWLSTGAGVPPELPVHPWHRERMLERHPWLTPTGYRIPARPLMALRTLAPVADPRWHLKVALELQMASSVRLVPAPSLHNGPALSGPLAQLGARAGVVMLAEAAAGAALEHGEPVPALGFVRRQSPARRPGELVLPLAALFAPAPASERPLVTEVIQLGYQGDPRPFVADLMTIMLPPLIRVLHAGIALEAHGQNLLVSLRKWRPARLFYRDFGAVRVSERRMAAAGMRIRPLRGDLDTDDPALLRAKLAASVLSLVVAQLAAVLRAEYDLPPAQVWSRAAKAAQGAYLALPAAAAGDRAALFAPTLPVKAMLAMRLAADQRAERFATLPNPLADFG